VELSFFFGIAVVIFAAVLISKGIRIVPQQQVWIIERLGKYHASLSAGLHFTVPFIDVLQYKHSLKEAVIDIPSQICITRDNVSVAVDGVVFFRVIDPVKASYGISNYEFGAIQLAQTTLRSEVGKLDLDRTFEEREKINNSIVIAIDMATEAWGVKVLRYEIKNIQPPKDVLDAMEKQMRAEREKRAKILESEADRDSRINRADGLKQETVKASEAEKSKQINEAEGKAAAILSIANATAEGLRQVAITINQPGGAEAARLKVAEEFLKQMGQVAFDARTIIVPANVTDPASMIASAMSVFDQVKTQGKLTTPPALR
jgi:regulator of protease activity HflC (stomatin/prohibitin superfamily)